jgi:hypothetical protein
MALDPAASAAALDRYFAAHYRFEPERQIQSSIIYRRLDEFGHIERIVVKYASQQNNDEIRNEEEYLRAMWGAEHVTRLISIVDDQDHATAIWDSPLYRYLQNLPSLPWKLAVDAAPYPNTRGFAYFVMEYLNRDTA